MKLAIEEYQQQAKAKVDGASSCLLMLDHGRKLFVEENEKREYKEGCNEDDSTARRYHFLRLLNGYQQCCNSEGRYLLAKEFSEHELRLRKDEEERQVAVVKRKHDRDRSKIVQAHARQIEHFRESEC